MRSLLREPLLHFVLLGTVVFLLHRAVVTRENGRTSDEHDDARTIVIDDTFVEALARDHQSRTGRAPDHAARKALVATYVRDEVLHREARRLGLDAGDTIVRRRMVQTMEFLLEGTVEIPEPTNAELERWLREHADDYRLSPRLSLTHVYFARDRRRDRAEADARQALSTITARSVAPSAAPQLGDPFLLGADVAARDRRGFAGTFGNAFAERLFALPHADTWQGPIESSYGWHLVRVTARSPGGMPALDAVRPRVVSDWREARRTSAAAEAVDRLVAEYRVQRLPGKRTAR